MDYKNVFLERFKTIEKALNESTIAVGWIDGNGSAQTAYAHLQAKAATGEDQPAVGKSASLALIARTLNYGREPGTTATGHSYGRIPARPFMAFAQELWEKTYNQIIAANLPKVLKNECSIDDFFKILGSRMRSTIQKAIRTGQYTPLAEKTKQRRRNKSVFQPLVDTGRMVNSVSFEIRRGNA